MVEVMPHRFQQSWKFRAVEDADRKLILEELNSQEAFAAWENGLEN
jgi:heme-degrading monooxygenase HmoA